MVNGRVIVSDSRSLTLDSGVIITKAREYRSRVEQSLHTLQSSIPLTIKWLRQIAQSKT
jgi:hypothetical protein